MYQDQEEEDDEEGEDEEEEEDEEDDEEGEEEGNLETDEESSDDDALDGAAPTPKRRKFARDKALEASLGSGLYPTFQGIHGPAQDLNPKDNDALEYLRLLWPESLCELIALETDRYANQKGVTNWVSVSVSEVWSFLGIVILMGVHRLPRIRNYWSKDCFLGISALQGCMSLSRFWALWSNLHVVDNQCIEPSGGVSRKIKPVLDTLTSTFLRSYSPGQELSVDEGMVKYTGRAGGKVVMPNKPIRKGFKIWSCSCSCCGYLCTFQVYQGCQKDVVTGKKTPEKGLARRVVMDLVAPFAGLNHVVYCDNFYSSGPLADELAKDQIFIVGTIKKCARGFPDNLKAAKPPAGEYVRRKLAIIAFLSFKIANRSAL